MDLELQQLDLRYGLLRIRAPRRERSLAASIAEVGQLVPITVVPDSAQQDRYVVLDGFRRVRALERLRHDTVAALEWELPELEGLLLLRSLRGAERESILEQAWLLAELRRRFDLTMEQLARRFDRTTSWVSRRLALVRELPDGVQAEIQEGRIVPHAAAKYLVPLARANRDHCERLAHAIAKRDLSSRDIGLIYAGWRDGDQVTRERLIDDPDLFLRARQARDAEERSPRDQLLKDVGTLAAIASRARQRMRCCARYGLREHDYDDLLAGLGMASGEIRRLVEALQESRGRGDGDARSERTDGDPGAEEARLDPSADRAGARSVARSSPARDRVGNC